MPHCRRAARNRRSISPPFPIKHHLNHLVHPVGPTAPPELPGVPGATRSILGSHPDISADSTTYVAPLAQGCRSCVPTGSAAQVPGGLPAEYAVVTARAALEPAVLIGSDVVGLPFAPAGSAEVVGADIWSSTLTRGGRVGGRPRLPRAALSFLTGQEGPNPVCLVELPPAKSGYPCSSASQQ